VSEINGAQALVRTLVDSGVEVCFANPGISEMHFVGALDAFPQMRGVLCLFEGVATGAADGYARMTGRPAGGDIASPGSCTPRACAGSVTLRGPGSRAAHLADLLLAQS
jgi:hypothetical protein